MYKVFHNGKFVGGDIDPKLLYSVYEVVRISQGKFRFLTEHLLRLERSWSLSDRLRRKEYIGFERLSDICREVLRVNNLTNQNIRIDLDSNNILVRPVESFYPAEKDYETGVDTMSFQYVRSNPNAKANNILLKEKVKQIRSIENVFEVLLFNEEENLLEGSQSNLFFIKGNVVYTAPVEQVLAGITREVLMSIIEKRGDLRLNKKPIPLSEVYYYDCCFITGTSIDLLPVRRIDSQIFQSASNPVYQSLLKDFRDAAREQQELSV